MSKTIDEDEAKRILSIASIYLNNCDAEIAEANRELAKATARVERAYARKDGAQEMRDAISSKLLDAIKDGNDGQK